MSCRLSDTGTRDQPTADHDGILPPFPPGGGCCAAVLAFTSQQRIIKQKTQQSRETSRIELLDRAYTTQHILRPTSELDHLHSFPRLRLQSGTCEYHQIHTKHGRHDQLAAVPAPAADVHSPLAALLAQHVVRHAHPGLLHRTAQRAGDHPVLSRQCRGLGDDLRLVQRSGQGIAGEHYGVWCVHVCVCHCLFGARPTCEMTLLFIILTFGYMSHFLTGYRSIHSRRLHWLRQVGRESARESRLRRH